MGIFDDIGDFVSDAADVVSDAAGDASDAAGDALGDGLEGLGEGAGWLGGGLGDAIGAVATVVDDATGGLAGDSLNFLDDTVFDTVDYLSGGLIDVDFDDGTFSASAGIDGVMSMGASLGEHGVTYDTSTITGGFNAGLTDEGLDIGGSAGIDFGPLPYADGHLGLGADGTVSIDGNVQGTIPTPIGLVSGDVEGGFTRTPDGAWAGNVSLDGQLTLPSGTYVGANLDVAHQQTADGDSITSVGVGGRLGEYGVGEVGVGGQYTHAEVDGVTLDSVSGEAHASGYGFEAGVEGGYQRVEAGGNVVETGHVGGHVSGYGQGIEGEANYSGMTTADGQSVSNWTTDGSVTFDGDKLAGLGKQLFGDQAGDLAGGMGLPDSADGLVGMLSDGGTADLLGQLGGDQLAGFVNSPAPEGAQQLVGKLISDGNFGSLLGGDGAAVQNLLGKVADAGGLPDVLGQLDPGTTANLIGTLSAPAPAPAMATTPAVDAAVGDALGVATQAATDLVTGAITPDAAQTEMAGAIQGIQAAAPADAVVTADVGATATVSGDTVTVDATADVTMAPAPAPEPAPEPEPVDTFTQQIQAADQVEQSVDDLFEGL